jgi:uncharacterized linocin/CFP29 family protein
MADYLHREQAPLTSDEWEKVDKAVTEVAAQQAIGRRFLAVVGPLGAGHLSVPRLALAGVTPASADGAGQGNAPVSVETRGQANLALIHKDFTLHWRDLEAARQAGIPLDLAAASTAAAMCIAREDELIFHGDKTLGIEGLATASGRRTTVRRDWGIGGHAFLDVVEAVEHMAAAGYYPPYALICTPNLYACLVRVYGSTGVLELTQVRELCTAGVFQSVQAKSALLVATGAHNLDLVIGQDLTTAYLHSADMDHVFRVLETVAVRIKRPGAICSMVPRTAGPSHRVRRGVPEEATGAGD